MLVVVMVAVVVVVPIIKPPRCHLRFGPRRGADREEAVDS